MFLYSSVFVECVCKLKETEKGVTEMCQAMEKLYNEGVEFGEERRTKKIALSLASMHMSVEDIALAVEMSVETVQDWISQQA